MCAGKYTGRGARRARAARHIEKPDMGTASLKQIVAYATAQDKTKAAAERKRRVCAPLPAHTCDDPGQRLCCFAPNTGCALSTVAHHPSMGSQPTAYNEHSQKTKVALKQILYCQMLLAGRGQKSSRRRGGGR